jgi:hypothetical protein
MVVGDTLWMRAKSACGASDDRISFSWTLDNFRLRFGYSTGCGGIGTCGQLRPDRIMLTDDMLTLNR